MSAFAMTPAFSDVYSEYHLTKERSSHSMTEMEQEHSVYTYRDLVKRLYDLEALAVPPQAGEKSGCFSRRLQYLGEAG
jgi:hypothetical protein